MDTNEVPRALVVDIPANATASEMEALLNDACPAGYYLLSVLPWATGARGIIRPYRATEEKRKPDELALDFIRNNREMPIARLKAGCEALGCRRGVVWVTERRADVLRTARIKA